VVAIARVIPRLRLAKRKEKVKRKARNIRTKRVGIAPKEKGSIK